MSNMYFKSIKFNLIVMSCATIFTAVTASDVGREDNRRDKDTAVGGCVELTSAYAKANGFCSRVFARGDHTDYLPAEHDNRTIEELVAAALAARGSKQKGGNRIT